MKMPTEVAILPTQPEKPHHYTYLKEFRTQQCPLFVQHKCTQHRPFTCFHWHFANQKRRRPVRKKDGTFNYSSDVYCAKYDENSGICVDGDECPFLHRTAGDTERRYHLRYYKTGTCVHDTDSKGHCEKNGAHCAFAHGQGDLRAPVYDVRDLHAMELGGGCSSDSPQLPSDSAAPRAVVGSLEKEKSPGDDPCWSDASFVLANYKTEPCKKPPRMCRQGYACPQYHNSRDRRRSPHKHRYSRSTPCPNVKHGDEWGDPQGCDSGDACAYCHTRTEQQFHPEIYKSTKCNDMMQTGYCPRGPFCAFAHVDHEMAYARDGNTLVPGSHVLAEYIQSGAESVGPGLLDDSDETILTHKTGPDVLSPINGKLTVGSPGLLLLHEPNNNAVKIPITYQSSQGAALPDPIGKGRTNSVSSSDGRVQYDDSHVRSRQLVLQIDNTTNECASAPADGSASASSYGQLLHRQHRSVLHGISNNFQSHSFGSNASTPSSNMSASISPFAIPFFQSAGDFAEQHLSNTQDELNFDDFDLTSIEKELERDDFNDNGSGTGASSAGASLSGYQFTSAASTMRVSMPVSIPTAMPGSGGSVGQQRGCIPSSLPQSPACLPTVSAASPMAAASLPMLFFPSTPRQLHSFQEMQSAFLGQPQSFPGRFAGLPLGSDANVGSHSSLAVGQSSESIHNSTVTSSPVTLSSAPVPIPQARTAGGSQSGSTTSASLPKCQCANGSNQAEVSRLRDELTHCRARLSNWEEGYAQAKTACDAWRKEVEDLRRKIKESEEQKHAALKQRDEALAQLTKAKQDAETKSVNSCLKSIYKFSELETLPVSQLKGLQQQLRRDQEKLEQVVQRHYSCSSR